MSDSVNTREERDAAVRVAQVAQAERDELRAQLEDAQARVHSAERHAEALKILIEARFAAVDMVGILNAEDGTVRATVRGFLFDWVRNLGMHLLADTDAPNFVTFSLEQDGAATLVVTFARKYGKTPAEVIGDLQGQLTEAQKEIAASRGLPEGALPGWEWTTDEERTESDAAITIAFDPWWVKRVDGLTLVAHVGHEPFWLVLDADARRVATGLATGVRAAMRAAEEAAK